jgi:hypothetical protein
VPGILLAGDPPLFPSYDLKTAKFKKACVEKKEREKERRICLVNLHCV